MTGTGFTRQSNIDSALQFSERIKLTKWPHKYLSNCNFDKWDKNRVEVVGEQKISEFQLVIEVKKDFPEEAVIKLRPKGKVGSH